MSGLKLLLPVALLLLSGTLMAVSSETPPPAAQPQTQSAPGNKSPARDNSKTRGQLLYETHCIACHQSTLHIRDRRKAKSIAEINQWVSRWVSYQKLNWTIEDIQLVANYLNQQFYHYKE